MKDGLQVTHELPGRRFRKEAQNEMMKSLRELYPFWLARASAELIESRMSS